MFAKRTLSVEEQGAELLAGLLRQGDPNIGQKRGPGRDDGASGGLAPGQPFAKDPHELEVGQADGADARSGQLRQIRRRDRGETAEPGEKGFDDDVGIGGRRSPGEKKREEGGVV